MGLMWLPWFRKYKTLSFHNVWIRIYQIIGFSGCCSWKIFLFTDKSSYPPILLILKSWKSWFRQKVYRILCISLLYTIRQCVATHWTVGSYRLANTTTTTSLHSHPRTAQSSLSARLWLLHRLSTRKDNSWIVSTLPLETSLHAFPNHRRELS